MRIRTATDLGAAIRDFRRRRGWDQQKLAQEVGVSRQWIIDIEKGKPRAGVELVLRTLDALGIPFDLKPSAALQDSPRKTDISDIITRTTRSK